MYLDFFFKSTSEDLMKTFHNSLNELQKQILYFLLKKYLNLFSLFFVDSKGVLPIKYEPKIIAEP